MTSERLLVQLALTDAEADRLAEVFPRAKPDIDYSRDRRLRDRCGIRHSYADGVRMPPEIFVLESIMAWWWYNIALVVNTVEYERFDQTWIWVDSLSYRP